jgi:hypothetical protein
MTTSPPDYEDADPGLARVRTSLAWTRTALSFAAVGAVALRKDVIAGLLIFARGLSLIAESHQAGGDPERIRRTRVSRRPDTPLILRAQVDSRIPLIDPWRARTIQRGPSPPLGLY